ncbi:MAG: hypothetical protein HQL53_12420 [Magnetococcales bacterium]|nr:hypothetical protein [Magnetococcales bacterium]
MYNLIFTSRKLEAKRFKRWVTGEVLPAIRRTGHYGSLTPLPFSTSPALVADLTIARFAMDALRVSDAGKLLMFNRIATLHGRPTEFLPDYTEENVTRSLTDLLKEHGESLTARQVNLVLLELGILEEMTRPASKGKTKRFKALTKKGLSFGKNLISPRNERETQPHYFKAKFPELMDRVHDWLSQQTADAA